MLQYRYLPEYAKQQLRSSYVNKNWKTWYMNHQKYIRHQQVFTCNFKLIFDQ